MTGCCENKTCAIDQLQDRQSGTLKVVLGINAVMFVVVLAAGLYAASTSLLADSLDNLGDALTYAVSIYAVGRSVQIKGRVALFKGTLILAAGLFVIAQVILKILHPSLPIFEAMGVTGALALAALPRAAVEAPQRRREHEFRLGMFAKRYRGEYRSPPGRRPCLAHRFGLA